MHKHAHLKLDISSQKSHTKQISTPQAREKLRRERPSQMPSEPLVTHLNWFDRTDVRQNFKLRSHLPYKGKRTRASPPLAEQLQLK